MSLECGLLVLAGVTINLAAAWQLLHARNETLLERLRSIGQRAKALAAIALFLALVFIQDLSGKIHLRLDHGYNVATKTVDYHWNLGSKQTGGMKAEFGILDHTPVGSGGKALYQFARYFRWGGRVLVVVGVGLDALTVVQSSNPLRAATQAVAGWAGAWLGCKTVGAFGAGFGSGLEPGLGTAIGGVIGCVIGSATFYYAMSDVAGHVYDWGQQALFHPLPELPGPP